MCLHVYDWLLVVVVESNLSVHFCVQERDLFKWRMIIAVVRNFVQLRKESLKKIQACTTGFEPLTDTGAALCQFSCCCHLSHEFYRRVTVICLFHKALRLFTCLDLCSIASLSSVPETFHARLPVSVKSQYRDPSKLCFLFWPWKCPRREGVSLRQCSLWYVVPAYRRQRSSANKVQPNMFLNTFRVILFNTFWKFLRLGNSAWDFLGVNFDPGTFLSFIESLRDCLGFWFLPPLEHPRHPGAVTWNPGRIPPREMSS